MSSLPWRRFKCLLVVFSSLLLLYGISGSYMTVVSDIGHVGDKVTLWSPMKTFKRGSELTFMFHMLIRDEDTTAKLTVFTYSQMHVYEQQLLAIGGNQGTSWISTAVCLPEGTYQLAFVAIHGFQFLSDIALSNVVIFHSEHCKSTSNAGKGKHCANTSSLQVVVVWPYANNQLLL